MLIVMDRVFFYIKLDKTALQHRIHVWHKFFVATVVAARGHPESTYAPREGEGGRRKAYESVLGGGGVNAIAYVRFEKNSTSNCCFPTHIRVSYSFHRCGLGIPMRDQAK